MNEKGKNIEVICKTIYEMIAQAPHDFCGEQREFYLPRLRDAFCSAGMLFPQQMARAIESSDEKKGK